MFLVAGFPQDTNQNCNLRTLPEKIRSHSNRLGSVVPVPLDVSFSAQAADVVDDVLDLWEEDLASPEMWGRLQP